MFGILKVMMFAAFIIGVSIVVAPHINGSGTAEMSSDVDAGKAPATPMPRAGNGTGVGDTLQVLAQVADQQGMDMEQLRRLPKEDVKSAVQAVMSKAGDLTEDQVRRLAEDAAGEAKRIVTSEGFFVKPGTTRPGANHE